MGVRGEGERDEEWCVPQRISCLWKLLADQWAHLDERWSLADEKEVTRVSASPSALHLVRLLKVQSFLSNIISTPSCSSNVHFVSNERLISSSFSSSERRSLKVSSHLSQFLSMSLGPETDFISLWDKYSLRFRYSLSNTDRCNIVDHLSNLFFIGRCSLTIRQWRKSLFSMRKHSLTRWSLGDWRAEMREDELRSHLRIVIDCRFT